jgi:hypothetical protein
LLKNAFRIHKSRAMKCIWDNFTIFSEFHNQKFYRSIFENSHHP